MTRLERELQALASSVDWRDEPDVAALVARRIAGERPGPARPRRLALAVAVVLVALLAAFAVPPARTAILDWLGIGGARIVRVDELPSLPATPGIELLGNHATVGDARARAGFRVAAPPGDEPPPDEVLLAPGVRVTYVWRDGDRVRLLVTQFPGDATEPGLVKKFAASGTRLEELEIDGYRALWLEGGPHAVLFVAPDGSVRDDLGWLAGNTLLVDVDVDGVTVRIEAEIDREDAVELARAIVVARDPSSEG